jgi:Mrp family chromosome partitioning ATPase
MKLCKQFSSVIKHKLLVLSGKGGVGKSTVSAHIALELASRGHEVGLLDVDICGPSIPKMMGLEGHKIHQESSFRSLFSHKLFLSEALRIIFLQDSSGWSPVFCHENLCVISLGFMLADKDKAILWRGAKKNAMIKHFIEDVNWGILDYLVVDTPPGTSDEHLSIVQALELTGPNKTAALIITTPQEISLQDVRKEINFCKQICIPIVGVVENMSSIIADAYSFTFKAHDATNGQHIDLTSEVQETLSRAFPNLHLVATQNIFHHSLVEPTTSMAKKLGIPFLGSIPFQTSIGKTCEEGKILYNDSHSHRFGGNEYSIKTIMEKLGNEIRNFWS